jgi:hypothetical protein
MQGKVLDPVSGRWMDRVRVQECEHGREGRRRPGRLVEWIWCRAGELHVKLGSHDGRKATMGWSLCWAVQGGLVQTLGQINRPYLGLTSKECHG